MSWAGILGSPGILGYRWVSWGKSVQKREKGSEPDRETGKTVQEHHEVDRSLWKDQEGGYPGEVEVRGGRM